MRETDQQKVLVTGGGGFIGHHLVEQLLERDYNVTCFDRFGNNLPPQTRFIAGDITNQDDVRRAMEGKSRVFHLAGMLGTSELQTQCADAVKTNILGAIHVFQAAAENGTRVVQVSKPNIWENVYSQTKKTADWFCRLYQREHGLEAVTVKWFNVYGPRQKYYGVEKFVPTAIIRALRNEPVKVYGTGNQEADFIHVSDSNNATILLSETPAALGGVFEVGTGHGTRVNDLAETIIRLSHSKSTIEHVPMRPGEDLDSKAIADLTAINRVLKWSPRVSLERGMLETIAYYRKMEEKGLLDKLPRLPRSTVSIS